jgi:polar amino acid transport system substrate-binding protein
MKHLSRGRAGGRGLVAGVTVAVAVVALVLVAAGCGTTTSRSPGPSATTAAWTAADLAAITTDSSLMAMLPARNQSSGVIKCMSDIPYPPWEFYSPETSTNPAGFDFDLSQALGKKIGIKVAFTETPFDSALLAVKGGKGDMIMSDMYDSATRQKSGYSFVDYSFDGTGILVLKGNPQGIKNRDSRAGKTVACESGTTQQAFLQTLNTQFQSAGKPAMQILSLPKQPDALLAVQSKRAVADLTDRSTAINIAATTNHGNTFEVVNDPSAPKGYDPQMVAIGMSAKNTQLINTMQKALQALIDDGTLQKIAASWGLTAVTSATVNQGPAWAASQAASPSASSSP